MICWVNVEKFYNWMIRFRLKNSCGMENTCNSGKTKGGFDLWIVNCRNWFVWSRYLKFVISIFAFLLFAIVIVIASMFVLSVSISILGFLAEFNEKSNHRRRCRRRPSSSSSSSAVENWKYELNDGIAINKSFKIPPEANLRLNNTQNFIFLLFLYCYWYCHSLFAANCELRIAMRP